MNIGIFALSFLLKISGVLSSIYVEEKTNKTIQDADKSNIVTSGRVCAMSCNRETKCKSFSLDSTSNTCRIHYKTLADAEDQGEVIQSLTIQHYHKAICAKTWAEWGNCTFDSSVWTRVRNAKIDEKKNFNSLKCYLEEEEETQNCIEINECDSNPCQNNGACADLLVDYDCTCTPGWDGKNCQINIDDCLNNNNCLNGGKCVDGIASYTCNCTHTGFEGITCQTSVEDRLTADPGNCDANLPRSCEEILELWPAAPSNYYLIRVSDTRSDCTTTTLVSTYSSSEICCHPVNCDMDTYGKGWTVMQRRTIIESFQRDWATYENGFGLYPDGYWLGLGIQHVLTSKEPMDLLVELYMEEKDCWAYTLYNGFSIGSTLDEYPLFVLDRNISNIPYNGDDSLLKHNGTRFSTDDNDNDDSVPHNCANMFKGGWWFTACAFSNLNGPWIAGGCHTDGDGEHILWTYHAGKRYSYNKTQMMFRSHHYSQSHPSSLDSKYCSDTTPRVCP